jgi:outer membrane protein assembly factor BamB
VLLYGDLVYVCTSNGVDRSHDNVPYPESPSLIALDKNTGCLAAKDGENIGKRLFHGQWSSPAMGMVNGKPQVFFGGGDGVCYAFEPPRAWSTQGEVALLRKIWSCDCNPPDYKFRNGKPIPYQKKHNSFNSDTRGEGPSEIISTPVFYNNRVYVAVGQDPQHGRGEGALTCIDATRQDDITETGRLWTCKLVDRSLSTVSIADGLVYIADYSGNLHCLDADTGERYWVHETNSPIWSSTLVADGKIYLGTENRDLWVLKTGKEKKILAQIRLREKMYNTPVVANGVLYVATQQYLYAIQSPH